MRVLFIGPVPPPITGHSLACKVLIDELAKAHTVNLINLSKDTFVHGVGSLSRINAVARILFDVWRKRNKADVIYLTVSESLAGNLKDLVIYLACFRQLSQMVVHVHGGSLRRRILDRSGMLRRINRFFMRRLGAVIVLGPTHLHIFDGLVPRALVHIVPNFAEDYLFASRDEVATKFGDAGPLRVLFLGNLIEGKGVVDIVSAYQSLNEVERDAIRIDFAGACETEAQKAEFINRINGSPHLRYHGLLDGESKRHLLVRSHVLCLPTTLSEGQPISILEAYAAGCAVIATNSGGIRDVFSDEVHGFEVTASSVESLKEALRRCISRRAELMPIAISNCNEAREKYRTSLYVSSVLNILGTVQRHQ